MEEGRKARDVKVVFKASEVKVSVGGEQKVGGKLGGGVIIDECTWTVEGGEVVVDLGKRGGETDWSACIL